MAGGEGDQCSAREKQPYHWEQEGGLQKVRCTHSSDEDQGCLQMGEGTKALTQMVVLFLMF